MYQIKFSKDALTHLKYFKKFDQKHVMTGIKKQLLYEPLHPVRNRKPLRQNPLSRWELRIDKFRVFYDVVGNCVEIKAVGYKEHNTLYIAGKEFEI